MTKGGWDMTREQAWQLLCEWTPSESLRKHGLAVEAAMRFYAARFGEPEEEWAAVGLLHDFDYERYPTEQDHPFRGVEHLRTLGVPETWLNAILSHASYSGVQPETLMAKTLVACDELTGLVTAAVLVLPSKKLADLKPSSVRKRMKETGFARKVNREDILRGADLLGVSLDEHIENVVRAMQAASAALDS
ncbi:HAD family hydrolase [candidate division KSB1 bacterium]|nr:MAG: HAD family hydrolase [candidate division KSB1 bacterium]